MQRFANSSLRSFASIVSTAHNFTRDQRVRIKRCFFFFTAGPTEVNRHFLENEYDDLSFFSLYEKQMWTNSQCRTRNNRRKREFSKQS